MSGYGEIGNPRSIFVHAWRDRMPAAVAIERLAELLGRYAPAEVLIDDDNAWRLLKRGIEQRLREARLGRIPYFRTVGSEALTSA